MLRFSLVLYIFFQHTVFNSITTFHVNSMTSAGQCRLAPLIPLIQDSNQLYDFLVRIMFKLHSNLPNDVLIGMDHSYTILLFVYHPLLNRRRPFFFHRSPRSIPNYIRAVEIFLQSSPQSSVFCKPNNCTKATGECAELFVASGLWCVYTTSCRCTRR